MNVVIAPGRLSGSVETPSSKSYAHRLLIAATLADGPAFIGINAVNEDITATFNCLRALGAKIELAEGGVRVRPVAPGGDEAELFCGESGSTLRFMLPVAAALGRKCTFTGAGRLPERPNAPLTAAMRAHGVRVSSDFLPCDISGRLEGGDYEIVGNISSQYITGLLLALPLCARESRLHITTRLESAPYVAITIEVLGIFGVRILPAADGYYIEGGQRYKSPGAVEAEGDWSGAAFWLAANYLGSDVRCTGLNPASIQADRAIEKMLGMLGGQIDISETPDLAPALAVAAARYPGTTRITGAARLRIKESDRLSAICELVNNLGGDCRAQEDGLVITGVPAFSGGVVDGYNDHRIVMAAAVAATAASGPVTIKGAEAVKKSYPKFFEEFKRLGGNVRV